MKKLLVAAITLMIATMSVNAKSTKKVTATPAVEVGAAQVDEYIPLLKGKRVALLSNNTGMVGSKHTLDILLENDIKVAMIFSPEHGFRGKADAGEHVSSSVDEQTGVRIASLYDGKGKYPSKENMDQLDIIVVDIQDVGLRYYTYYITMINLMEAASMNGKDFMVLDRPNPNGMIVDGPILDMKYRSGVGRLPIPTVHGMTLGEIALMANGEGWLKDGMRVDNLTVIKCKNYTHQTRYQLPIAPSPNLPNMQSVYLYTTLCYFEGAQCSLGRGTDKPFQIYGNPQMKGKKSYTFTPVSRFGAKNPPFKDQQCWGVDLSKEDPEKLIKNGVSFEYVIDAYKNSNMGEKFFTPFFEKLAGVGYIRTMIMEGKSNAEIKAMWADDVKKFKEQRRPYLLYEE